jgi:hypothetical protein
MAHQQQTQPYNGGGRGRGYNNNGGRGNNGAYNPNHMQTSNYPPNMNYGGRGSGGGGAIPHQIGAWQPAPTSATATGPVYPSHSHGNVPPSLVPGATTQQQLQSPPLGGGGGIQSPPLNASLQQQQANRTPNLQPAPPHQYGVVTPQQPGSNASQQQQRLQQPPQQNYNPYNNSYVQYGYPPDRQQHQWQEQQQIPYNPYGGAARTTPGGGAMFYPTMQPQQPGVVVNGGLLHANLGVGSAPTTTTPNVVPPPRPKKILTITVRYCFVLLALLVEHWISRLIDLAHLCFFRTTFPFM